MIVPTAEFDPMYAKDEVPFRTKMVRYIEREFGDMPHCQQWLQRNEPGLQTPLNHMSEQTTDAAIKALRRAA